MSRGTVTLMVCTLLVTLAAAERLVAQDEHEQLRLQMVATHGQAVALFHQVKASSNMQGQPGAALHTMQALLEGLGALLAVSACNPEHYARINQQLLARWHDIAGASRVSTEELGHLQTLHGLFLEQQRIIQRLADFHARQAAVSR